MTQPQPDDAQALRNKLVDDLIAQGIVRTPAVENALRTVPRHVFAPEVTTTQAYADETVVTKYDADGLATSSVSAPQVIAMMLELLAVQPGQRVLEIGSGGYNAALLSELVGDTGHVTTIDIDEEVIARATRFLPEAGYHGVAAIQADGEFGLPDGAPYDRIIVTVGAPDIPPAWTAQLAPEGRLVVPLRLRNLTRALALDRIGRHLVGADYGVCGFVYMQGAGRSRERLVLLSGEEVGLRFDWPAAVDPDALREALTQPGVEVWSGVTVGAQEPFDDLDLYQMTITPGFCLIATKREALDAGLVNASWLVPSPAVTDGTSFAYRMRPRPVDDSGTRYELGVRGHGPNGKCLAEEFAEQMRVWHREHRGQRAHFEVYPAGTPSRDLPEGGLVIDKRHTRVAVCWP
ncbi:methyltransferase, FxLD system [Micromonospora sp. C51]|uniref:methyltransferase, FxLD system n=1 Tax=Micromonospora sp. C51 TaxID=2824879 RepID=UPI001B364768|nr:methyltransferase, FxLD system [Micromonospora sp. C51]MBQ1047811.1 methyltransferase, FxLD system [Micromonospora sp. C51]